MTLIWIRSFNPKFVSCNLMRFISCCCMLPAMIFAKVSFSIAQSSAPGETTLTVAVRGSWNNRARSPMYEFFVMRRTLLSLMNTSSSPFAMTKKDVPSLPCSMTVSPCANFVVTNDSTTFFVCSSDKCLKMWTFFARTIFRVNSEASSALFAMDRPRPFSADAMPSRVSIATRAPPEPAFMFLIVLAVLLLFRRASSSIQSPRWRFTSLSFSKPDRAPSRTMSILAPASTSALAAMSLTAIHFMSSVL
mmetsp:Transcript_40183/g.92982  ORF Transcript_40183/g.92982 Transcript_40183/m.92982 type:complete len:248 (+) Transcript_40183:984-1727(+)